MPQEGWGKKNTTDASSKNSVLEKMYHKTFRDKYTAGQSKTTKPQDRQKQIFHRMIGDIYTSGQLKTIIPQDSQRQICYKTVGDKHTTKVRRQIHCPGENVPQDS